MSKYLWFAAAAAAGAFSRAGITAAVQRVAGVGFPWGTSLVNVLGCFLFGVVWAVFEQKLVGPEPRLIVLTGFLGSFTTFSTYMFDVGAMLREGRYLAAGGNLAFQNLLGISFLFVGIALARAF